MYTYIRVKKELKKKQTWKENGIMTKVMKEVKKGVQKRFNKTGH